MIVILTFDSKHDIDVVRDDNGSAVTFPSVQDAQAWIDDNDSEVCSFTKIIDTDM